MKTKPLPHKFSLWGAISFANAKLAAINRLRKQESSQMQLAFERARVRAKVA